MKEGTVLRDVTTMRGQDALPGLLLLCSLLAVAAALGCEDSPAAANGVIPEPVPDSCSSWREDIEPVFALRCTSCHSGAAAAGRYDVSTYLGALGYEGPRTVATGGDPTSPLLQILDPASADAVHAPFGDVFPAVREWVVDCKVSYFRSQYHLGGILNPRDNPEKVVEFHGELIRSLDHDIRTCTVCHGRNFEGALGGSCLTCHTEGPGACDTCHGNPPDTGAHLRHGAGPLHVGFACAECHPRVDRYDTPGHFLLEDDSPDPAPVELEFGPLARVEPAAGGLEGLGAPFWDPATRTCSQVYCHGQRFVDSPVLREPTPWDRVGQEEDCGRCHSLPPTNHGPEATDHCVVCHSRVVDAQGGIADPTRHVNGELELGRGGEGCGSCHGQGDDPSPPPALDGSLDTTHPGVGAHAAHLRPRQKLRGPIPCSDCHLVPEEYRSPGHIDSNLPAEVFPPEERFVSLAQAQGAVPSYDHETGRCSGVYCHGAGLKLWGDRSPTLQRQPTWTAPAEGQAECGSCHGEPPEDGMHRAEWPLTLCHQCHAGTLDDQGVILLDEAGESLHVNGRIDLQQAD